VLYFRVVMEACGIHKLECPKHECLPFCIHH